MSEIDSGLINGANLVGGLIAQGKKTSDYIDGMFDAHAKQTAGNAIAAGDPGTAAAALGSRGFLDEAQALKDRAAASSTMTSLNDKDFTGAKAAAAQSGDPALYGVASGAEANDKAARIAWMGHAADALLQIKDPARRSQAYQTAIVPTLKAMGVPDAQLSAIGQQSLTDEGLQSFKASLGQMSKMEIKQDPNSGELLGVDPTTGKVTSLHPGTRKPDWKERKNTDGSTTWIDLNTGQEGAGPGGDQAAAPVPTGGVYDKIDAVATSAGAKPAEVAYLKRLGQVESSGKPDATNGKSTGLFQFHPDTFERAGGGDINDVADQTKAALNLSRQDRASLQAAGVQPTDANVYIMHQQGAAGGKALLTAPPEVNAVSVLAPIYGGNEKVARKAIVNNGGTADMTAGDFVSMWQKKWSGGAPATGGPRTIPGSEPVKDDGALSDDAAQQAAERYITNGALPPMGMGKTGTANRDKILNKAAEMEKATGRTGAEAVAAWAGVKASVAALSKLTSIRNQIEASEATVQKNAAFMLSLAPKGGGPTGSPVLNRVIQHARGQYAGDPDVSAFNSAIGTVADEYAKVMTTNTGSGGAGTSDAARKEAYSRLSNASTLPQLKSTVAALQTEMDNRLGSLKEQEASASAAIYGGVGHPKAAGVVAPHPEGWSKLLPAPQLATARKYAGVTAAGGTQQNPFVPTSQAQFDHLQSGQWFINPADGKPMVKK